LIRSRATRATPCAACAEARCSLSSRCSRLAIGIVCDDGGVQRRRRCAAEAVAVPAAERLVAVRHDAPGAGGLAGVDTGLNLSPSMMVTYRDQGRSFEKIGLWGPIIATVTGLGEPEQLPGAIVTGQLLPAFGVPPAPRPLDRRERRTDRRAAGHRARLRLLAAAFGGDRNVIGKSMTINGSTVQIVGVMPKGFRLGDVAVDVIDVYPLRPREAGPTAVFRRRHCAHEARRHDRAGERGHRATTPCLDRLVSVSRWRQRQRGLPRHVEDHARAPAAQADVIGTIGDTLWVVMAMIGLCS
jgi:hypothetical protein